MNKLIKNTSLYTVGSILPQIANLILLPIYTKYLSPAEYGIYTSMMMFNAVLIIFFTMGFERSLNRLYYDYKNPEQKKELFGTVSISIFIIATLFLIGMLLGQNIVGKVFKSIPVHPYFIITFFISYNSVFLLVPLIYFRMTHQAGKFITLSLSQFVLNATFAIIFLVVYDKKSEGLLLAQLISNAVLLPVFVVVVLRNFKPVFKMKYIKPVAEFSLPMIPALLAAWIINLSDRVFIENYLSLKEVGVYSLGYQIAQVTGLLSGSLAKAYNPLFYELAAKGEQSKKKLKKYNHLIIVFILTIAFGIALFSKELIQLFFNEEYRQAYIVSMIVALSYFISASSGLLNLSIYQEKKSLKMMYFVLISAGINIGLNFLLIPPYGMYGAAVATVVTFVIFFAIKYRYSKKCYFIPINISALIPLIVFAFGAVIITEFLSFESVLANIGIKFMLFLIFLYIVYTFNKTTLTEMNFIRNRIQ